MVKHCGESVIEIWSGDYINDPDNRSDGDKTASIIQIEPGSLRDTYIVEVIRK